MPKENRKKPRGGMRPRSRTAGPTVRATERTVEALELRKAGLSYRQIGERLGISAAAAHKLVSKALGELSERARDVAQETLALELERLDAMTALLWEELAKLKALEASQEGARPLSRTLAVVDRLIRLTEVRARLLRLDTATLQSNTAVITLLWPEEYGQRVQVVDAQGPKELADSDGGEAT